MVKCRFVPFCGDVGAMFGRARVESVRVGSGRVGSVRVGSVRGHRGTNHTTNQCQTNGNSSIRINRLMVYLTGVKRYVEDGTENHNEKNWMKMRNQRSLEIDGNCGLLKYFMSIFLGIV